MSLHLNTYTFQPNIYMKKEFCAQIETLYFHNTTLNSANKIKLPEKPVF